MIAPLILGILGTLPRAQLAAIARKALVLLAAEVEGATTNAIVHEGEVAGFGLLDELLAKVEGG